MNFFVRWVGNLAARSTATTTAFQLFAQPFAMRGKHTIKTNRSIAKRFRMRANGTLKRSKSGNQHNTGYKSRQKSNNLNKSTDITHKKMAKKMKICMGLLGK